MLSRIDKTNWNNVTLEDVVIRREENDKEHARERFDRFVKVEHMDAESLHLKRWGIQGEEELPPTFYKIFRKGQILFPTRNPHLRRTSLASFDGICGEKTLTLEPNTDVVDPNFLPFLFNSESFVAHTTSSIIGSTNPHVRWRDVAKYEFLLPPKEQQACLAELLWAADEVIERRLKVLNSLRVNELVLQKQYLTKGDFTYSINELGQIVTGSTPSTTNPEYWGKDVPFVSPAEIGDSFYVNRVERFLSKKGANESRLIPKDSILTVCIGSTIGKVAINSADVCTNQQINSLIPSQEFSSIYLLNLFRFYKQRIIDKSGATAVPIINKTDFGMIKLPIIKHGKQKEFVEKIGSLDLTTSLLISQISNSKQLQKSLINQIF